MRRHEAERIDEGRRGGKPRAGRGWGRRCGLWASNLSPPTPSRWPGGASRRSGAASRAPCLARTATRARTGLSARAALRPLCEELAGLGQGPMPTSQEARPGPGSGRRVLRSQMPRWSAERRAPFAKGAHIPQGCALVRRSALHSSRFPRGGKEKARRPAAASNRAGEAVVRGGGWRKMRFDALSDSCLAVALRCAFYSRVVFLIGNFLEGGFVRAVIDGLLRTLSFAGVLASPVTLLPPDRSCAKAETVNTPIVSATMKTLIEHLP